MMYAYVLYKCFYFYVMLKWVLCYSMKIGLISRSSAVIGIFTFPLECELLI